MRKVLLITFNLFLCLELAAQPNYFSVANQKDFFSVTHKLIKAGSNKYLIAGAYGGTVIQYFPQVLCINNSGNVIFDKTPFNIMYNHNQVTDIIATSDSNFLCVGHSDGCDIAGGEMYAEKIDSNGNTIWSKTYLEQAYYYSKQFVLELSNGNIAFQYNKKILFLNSIGDTLNSVIIANDSVRSFQLTPDNYLLIGYYNKIERRNSSGSLITSRNLINGATNIIVKSSNEYVFNSGTILYRTDSLFSAIDSANLISVLNSILDIQPDSAGYQLLSNQKVIKVDSLFNPGSLTLVIDSVLKIQTLLVDANKLILAGEELTGNGLGSVEQHTIVKSYDLNYQSVVETQDVGVINISTDSMNMYPFDGITSNFKFNIYTTVKNYGIDTLHDVAVNFYVYPAVANCNILEVSAFSHQVNIAPQDTIQIYMGAFEIPFYHPTLNLCVWSSSPNNQLDIDHSNDEYCKVFPVTYIISIEENNPLSEIQLSPNPAIENLQINIPKLITPINISLTDISGKEIMKKVIDQANTSLLLAEINPGMYFLKFNFANQQVVKKIIKQ